jgi:hypothetical protein
MLKWFDGQVSATSILSRIYLRLSFFSLAWEDGVKNKAAKSLYQQLISIDCGRMMTRDLLHISRSKPDIPKGKKEIQVRPADSYNTSHNI